MIAGRGFALVSGTPSRDLRRLRAGLEDLGFPIIQVGNGFQAAHLLRGPRGPEVALVAILTVNPGLRSLLRYLELVDRRSREVPLLHLGKRRCPPGPRRRVRYTFLELPLDLDLLKLALHGLE